MRSLLILAALAVSLPAAASERWVVKAPAPGATVAPTLIVTGFEPEAWPLEYAAGWAKVGAPCDCSMSLAPPGPPGAQGPGAYCLVRKLRAALCEAVK